MLRFEKACIFVIALIIAYVSVVKANGVETLKQSVKGMAILFSPVIAVLLFGIYAAVVIMWNVFKLRNFPSEYESMLKDIDEANDMLKRKGFKAQ